VKVKAVWLSMQYSKEYKGGQGWLKKVKKRVAFCGVCVVCVVWLLLMIVCVGCGVMYMYRSCLVQCMRRFNRAVKEVRKSGILRVCAVMYVMDVTGFCGYQCVQ